MERLADFFPGGLPGTAVTVGGESAFYQEVAAVESIFAGLEASLRELGDLATCKTLFDDKSREIDGLTQRIKSNLQWATTKIETLEKNHCAEVGSKDSVQHRATVVSLLRMKTMQATKEFTKALQIRRQTLESIEARRGMYVQNNAASQFDLEAQDDDILAMESVGNRQMLQQNFHQSRSEAVDQVQRLIGEVSTMFTRIAGIVGQQEEMVQRIDATMDDSLMRLREGHLQLMKYYDSIKNHRWLILKILGMLTAFSMFFIIFLA